MPPVISKEDRDSAMLCHLAALAGYLVPMLGWIGGPIIVWLLKRNDSRFVDEEGKEAINFNLSYLVYHLVAVGLLFVLIGIIILPLLWISHVYLLVTGAMKASRGEPVRYPFTIRFLS